VQVVRLVDLVGVDSILRDQTFEDALIVGPAVIAPLERVTMQNCSFSGDENSLFIEVQPDRSVIGVIGLIATTFKRCRFENVGIIGPPDAIEAIRSALLQGTAAQQAEQGMSPSAQPMAPVSEERTVPEAPVEAPAEPASESR